MVPPPHFVNQRFMNPGLIQQDKWVVYHFLHKNSRQVDPFTQFIQAHPLPATIQRCLRYHVQHVPSNRSNQALELSLGLLLPQKYVACWKTTHLYMIVPAINSYHIYQPPFIVDVPFETCHNLCIQPTVQALGNRTIDLRLQPRSRRRQTSCTEMLNQGYLWLYVLSPKKKSVLNGNPKDHTQQIRGPRIILIQPTFSPLVFASFLRQLGQPRDLWIIRTRGWNMEVAGLIIRMAIWCNMFHTTNPAVRAGSQSGPTSMDHHEPWLFPSTAR